MDLSGKWVLSTGDKTLSVSCTFKFNPNASPLRTAPPHPEQRRQPVPSSGAGAPGPLARVCASGTSFTWDESSCLSSLLDCLPLPPFIVHNLCVYLYSAGRRHSLVTVTLLLWLAGSAALRRRKSSPVKDCTHMPCPGRQILSPWTMGEIPGHCLFADLSGPP